MHIEKVKPDISGPSNNTNEEIVIRGVLVEVCNSAFCELTKENILSIPNLANVSQVGSNKVPSYFLQQL